jgi:hypothetical protein
MLKQLIMISDINEESKNGIICFQELVDENYKYFYCTRNTDFVEFSATKELAKKVKNDETMFYDIINQQITKITPQLFMGKIFIIASLNNKIDTDNESQELNDDVEIDSYILISELSSPISFSKKIMDSSSQDEIIEIYNIDVDSKLVFLPTIVTINDNKVVNIKILKNAI